MAFGFTTVSSQPVIDPATFFTFRRMADNRQLGDQLQLAVAGTPIAFNLPAAAGQVVVCEIDPQRYRFAHSPMFFISPGPPIRKDIQLLREPKAWTPRFTRWDDLPAAFTDLQTVLAASPKVTLFRSADPIADALTGAAYDGLSGEAITLAKTSFLNICFRLRTLREPVSMRPWFSFVQRVVAIGRERLLAFVEPEMANRVSDIDRHIDQFRTEYERTPAENHRGNVPAALQSRISSMVSIKSTHRKGNVQLTLTRLTGPDEVLLDTDIDESGDLLAHFLDLFKHKITGGTHPHDIHELLVLQEGQTPGFDLGYRLV